MLPVHCAERTVQPSRPCMLHGGAIVTMATAPEYNDMGIDVANAPGAGAVHDDRPGNHGCPGVARRSGNILPHHRPGAFPF